MIVFLCLTVLAALELVLYTSLAFNPPKPACLCLPSASIKDVVTHQTEKSLKEIINVIKIEHKRKYFKDSFTTRASSDYTWLLKILLR